MNPAVHIEVGRCFWSFTKALDEVTVAATGKPLMGGTGWNFSCDEGTEEDSTNGGPTAKAGRGYSEIAGSAALVGHLPERVAGPRPCRGYSGRSARATEIFCPASRLGCMSTSILPDSWKVDESDVIVEPQPSTVDAEEKLLPSLKIVRSLQTSVMSSLVCSSNQGFWRACGAVMRAVTLLFIKACTRTFAFVLTPLHVFPSREYEPLSTLPRTWGLTSVPNGKVADRAV
eukprot:CAMPEP_0180492812 /NCGR_PEP_ID=MMETSP1036_2-20121128/40382_1 /TAXON_ID=632150 /ORGANISM="Azadinium spinosum, Strain 3D9" /LENGTH=229 /DNA_ID=CAMNT_0022501165 /DNA_START=256 /DNA_END=946 /DNA_ORIENTATION=+